MPPPSFTRTDTLFPVTTLFRAGLAQRIDDALLCGLVDFGDVILRFFLVDRDCIQAIGGTDNQFAGSAGGAQRDIQHGLHGSITWSLKKARNSIRKAPAHVASRWWLQGAADGGSGAASCKLSARFQAATYCIAAEHSCRAGQYQSFRQHRWCVPGHEDQGDFATV